MQTDFEYKLFDLIFDLNIKTSLKRIATRKVAMSRAYLSCSESYSVPSPFLSKLRYAYRWNRKNTFYLLVYFKIESEIAVKSYKHYSFVLHLYLQKFSVSFTMF